jgi:hypothetical protein
LPTFKAARLDLIISSSFRWQQGVFVVAVTTLQAASAATVRSAT